MSWERRGGRRYYYRKRREGKRVISEYIGTGEAAEMRAEERQRRRKEQLQMERVEKALDELEAVTTALVQAALIVEGFHTHEGRWRKRQHERRNANPKAQIPISKESGRQRE